jgi:hypothetical protein
MIVAAGLLVILYLLLFNIYIILIVCCKVGKLGRIITIYYY